MCWPTQVAGTCLPAWIDRPGIMRAPVVCRQWRFWTQRRVGVAACNEDIVLHAFAGDAQTVLRLGRGETVTGLCLWDVASQQVLACRLAFGYTHTMVQQAMVVATEQGHDVGRILLLSTSRAHALLSGDELLAKLKVSKPIVAIQAFDHKHLVVSVEYQLLVYTLIHSTLIRQHCLPMSRTVTLIDCKDGVWFHDTPQDSHNDCRYRGYMRWARGVLASICRRRGFDSFCDRHRRVRAFQLLHSAGAG